MEERTLSGKRLFWRGVDGCVYGEVVIKKKSLALEHVETQRKAMNGFILLIPL